MLRLAALTALALVSTLGLLLVVLPGSAAARWLTVQPVLAHVVAFPVLLGVAAGVLATGALFWTLRTRTRRFGRTGVALAVLLAVSAVVLLLGPLAPRHPVPVTEGDRLVTVVTWNTADRLREEDLVRLYAETDPDVLVMPETTTSTVERIVEERPELPEVQVFGSVSSREGVAPTTVLVARSLGEYRALPPEDVPELQLGIVGLEPVEDPALPMIWGVHPPPPVPGLMDEWRHELQISAALAGCHDPGDVSGEPHPGAGAGVGQHRGTIAAGDFNAVLRHGPLADRERCTDAVDAVGSGVAGTWPASWPAWAGSPIDHVLVSGPLTPVSTQTHRIGLSDHRAVSARIRLG